MNARQNLAKAQSETFKVTAGLLQAIDWKDHGQVITRDELARLHKAAVVSLVHIDRAIIDLRIPAPVGGA